MYYNQDMKSHEISEKLNEIYNFTVDYIQKNHYPPTIREICAKCNIKSTASAYVYIEKLKAKGLLEKSPSKKRSLSVSKDKTNFKSIPLIGTITAGTPIFAVENLDGYYPLPPEFSINNETFALKVKGDSMINAGIYDKDVIIVEKSESAENGQIVVALIEDSATVKRFFIKDGKYLLHPENDQMQDKIYDELTILGIVKGLYRKF